MVERLSRVPTVICGLLSKPGLESSILCWMCQKMTGMLTILNLARATTGGNGVRPQLDISPTVPWGLTGMDIYPPVSLWEGLPPTCRRVFKLDIAWGCEVQQGVGDQPVEALVRVNRGHGNECGTRGGPLQDPLCVVGDPKGLELGCVVVDIQDVDRELGWGAGGSEYQR